MSIMDKIPKPPRLEKFCFMFDLYLSTKYTSMALCITWIIYLIGVIIDIGGGSMIWGIIWSLANIGALVLVVYGMNRNNRVMLLPALCICPFDVVAGLIQGIVSFATLHLFSAIWIFLQVGLMAYYWIALFSVYNDISSSSQATGDQESKPPMNPA